MPMMPGMIAKGHILPKIDEWIAPDPRARARQAERLLRDTQNFPTLIDVMDNLQPPIELSEPQQKHLTNDWFRDWWPDQQPVEPKVRRGLLEACVLARKLDRPFVLFWVCPVPQFQVWLAGSKQQITLMWATPAPPGVATGPFPDPEPLLVVKVPPLDPGAKLDGEGEQDGILTERLYTAAEML